MLILDFKIKTEYSDDSSNTFYFNKIYSTFFSVISDQTHAIRWLLHLTVEHAVSCNLFLIVDKLIKFSANNPQLLTNL